MASNGRKVDNEDDNNIAKFLLHTVSEASRMMLYNNNKQCQEHHDYLFQDYHHPLCLLHGYHSRAVQHYQTEIIQTKIHQTTTIGTVLH